MTQCSGYIAGQFEMPPDGEEVDEDELNEL